MKIEEEIEGILSTLPKVIRVCEGGGPDNLLATLALSVSASLHESRDREKELNDALYNLCSEIFKVRKDLSTKFPGLAEAFIAASMVVRP